jgi:hypothetical protein
MEVKVQKTESGQCFIEIEADESRVAISRKICGYDFEAYSDNIFDDTDNLTFFYGDYKKTFEVNRFDWSNPVKIEKEIRSRIQPVKTWIKECKAQAYIHKFTLK